MSDRHAPRRPEAAPGAEADHPTAGGGAWWVATVACVSFVLLVTLAPMPWVTRGSQSELGVLSPATWLDPLTWTTGSPRELVLNVLLFLPVGLLASRYGLRRGVLAPLLLTAAIEIVQIPMGGRMSDPRDLVANATGGAIGATLGLLLRRSGATPAGTTAQAPQRTTDVVP
jgi:glycopeptide antibiotics resistance protein